MKSVFVHFTQLISIIYNNTWSKLDKIAMLWRINMPTDQDINSILNSTKDI